MRTAEGKMATFLVGVFLVLFVLVAIVSCNGGGGGNTYYYPQDTTHGYYDTQHHYHYYPKYNPKSKVYVKPKAGSSGVKVKPAPRSNSKPNFGKPGVGGFGSKRR